MKYYYISSNKKKNKTKTKTKTGVGFSDHTKQQLLTDAAKVGGLLPS